MNTVETWPEALFLVNSILSLVGTCLLVRRMNRLWGRLSPSQQAHYLVLLVYAINVAGASTENLVGHSSFGWQHVASMVSGASLIAVVLWANRRADPPG